MGTIQPREIILVYAPRVIITLKTGDFNSPSASGQGAAAAITPVGRESITMQPYGFKALVTAEFWVAPTHALTRFMPGHDARIGVTDDGLNPNNTNIQITPSHHPLRPTTTFTVLCCTSGSTTFNPECSRLSSTVHDTGLLCSVSTSPLSLSYYHCIHPLRLYCYVMTHIIA